MFEWLEGREIEEGLYLNGEYNPETQMFVVENEEGNKIKEIDLIDSNIDQNIDYYPDWQHKLYNGLIRNEGKVTLSILSTESGDSWTIDIIRHKTLIPTHEYSQNLILINYLVYFCEEVKGDILSCQYTNYAGCGIDDEEKFTKWIENQIESVSEFNNTGHWNTIAAIVTSPDLSGEEEHKILNDLFLKKVLPSGVTL